MRIVDDYIILKIYTTLGYIVSLMLLNLEIVYIFNYKMFHQEASVETIKMLKMLNTFLTNNYLKYPI